jgi:hypothetical protein
MLLWYVTWIFISLLLIVLVHYLYSFFKNTLTVPKMRDLVNKPMERYNEIYTTIHESKNESSASSGSIANDNSDMQNELKQFLQHLHSSDTLSQPQIESHSMGMGSGSAFSSYS